MSFVPIIADLLVSMVLAHKQKTLGIVVMIVGFTKGAEIVTLRTSVGKAVSDMLTHLCEKCHNSRVIIPENGFHYVCRFGVKKAIECMQGLNVLYKPKPKVGEKGE